jgi:hypothetical protein
MSEEIEWYALLEPDYDGADIRAVRRFPGPPPYVAIARWRIPFKDLPKCSDWLARSLLRAQRELSALQNVDKFVDRPSANFVVHL